MHETSKVFKKLLLLMPIIGIVVLTNAAIDPAHMYIKGMTFTMGIADLIASGHNVGNVVNCDERLIQKFLIAKEKKVPDIVVIGSSRSMQIGTNVFPDKNVINNSVPLSALGDYLWILFDYEKKGAFPKTVIFGLDPWLLNPRSELDYWSSYKADTYAMLKELGISSGSIGVPIVSAQTTNLFSFSYFQTAIATFFNKDPLGDRFFSTDKETADYDMVLKDGRRYYKRYNDTETDEYVAGEAPKLISGFKWWQFQEPDPGWSNIFEKLVVYLQSKHVEVIIFLPPFHPVFYNSLITSAQDKNIVEIEEYYRALASRHHLRVIGSYDPSKCGLSGGDFYDGDHPSRQGVEKIFR